MSGGNVVAAFSVAGEPMSKARVRAAFLRVADRTHSKDPDAAFAVEAHFYAGTGQRRDVDNMLKLVLDGLNNVAWPDDVQVVEVIACKTAAGRVTVTCAGCGQEFERQRCHVRTTNYCTVKCRAKHTAPRRYAGARGVCTDCDGPTSKKAYARCMPCSLRAGGRWADRVQEGPLP